MLYNIGLSGNGCEIWDSHDGIFLDVTPRSLVDNVSKEPAALSPVRRLLETDRSGWL